MNSKIISLSNKLGINGAIVFTILTSVVQACGGLVSIFFIAKFLSASEQGYYYTFASLLAVQVFFELGLSGIITQYTAHEFAHLNWDKNVQLIGDEIYKSRLSSLLRFCIKWFGIISIGLFFMLIGAGFFFFSRYNQDIQIEWRTPWIVLSLAASMNLFIDPLLAFFDGLGEIRDMAKVRLVQKSVYVILLFTFFTLGFKLYSSALASLVAISVNYVQMTRAKRFNLIKIIWHAKNVWAVNYLKEIFPYQWRIALSWISGYFIFQLFNPILFATEGAVVAGQMGMTLQVLNGVSSISMSWITTKIPAFSNFIAKMEFVSLDRTFFNALSRLLSVNFLLLLIFNSGVFWLQWHFFKLGGRFLPILPTIIMSVTCFINQLIFSWAAYLRCHKKEPFLWQSIVLAILISLSTVILGKKFGLMGIISGYGFIILTVGLVWSYFIFKSKRKLWHQVN